MDNSSANSVNCQRLAANGRLLSQLAVFFVASVPKGNDNIISMNAVTIDFTNFRVVTSASRNCHFFVNCSRATTQNLSMLHFRAQCRIAA